MFSMKNFAKGKSWTNWSESFVSYPAYYAPTSAEQISDIIKGHQKKGMTIRTTGAAHSFSPVALPEHSALSLHHLRGLQSVDLEKMEATFYAGTYLYEIGPLLEAYGLAVINMGDIDVQSLAGVISTGTHGTGVTLGSFSSMAVKWTFIDGKGEMITHERGNDDLSDALHLSLGLLGVLVAVTIRVLPLYSLAYTAAREDFTTSLLNFRQEIRSNRHVEWYYFPGSDRIQVKRMNMAPVTYASDKERKKEQRKLELIENRLFEGVSKLCRWKPDWSGAVSMLSSRMITEGKKTDICYKVYPTSRRVKFTETEYAIPLEHFEACMEEIHEVMKKRTFPVHFPIECRTTMGERGFLSPTMGRESAFLAFHMYKGMDDTAYFRWVFELMKKYDGRAHWGKINCYDETDITMFYPDAEKFNEIRQLFDPGNIFMTHYFKHIFHS
ncbi:D-arabinono-1,4-lactone oxidase [Lysinibacillus sp. 3P01SB]|uniref:D-arabinono-1,4-lactone oxidase n=1 Tax=Lysinibacillus sp. 3P01SB TaxID=3132284 RepID=UPI0039A5C3A7